MFTAKKIDTNHKDLIHDVAFDYYGKRMATCSIDHTVKIWDLDENGEWVYSGSCNSHSGSVWKVCWAHPEFGQLLATCSFDKTAAVWEEVIGDKGQSTWIKRATLWESRISVTDVKFAPKNQGLQLATCSADGIVRIYETADVMKPSTLSVKSDIPTKLSSCSCLSWNPSQFSDDSNPSAGGKVVLLEYSESKNKWMRVDAHFAVTEPVNDIAFSPNMGRSYHLLAVATKDLRLFALKPIQPEGVQNQSRGTNYEIRLVGQFDDHGAPVWRVSWNMTGTILASSGDDNCVRLWKANYLDKWKTISVLKGDGSTILDESVPGNSSSTHIISGLQSAGRFFKLPTASHIS